uniref:Uncharacterized protein n=1 Tax=Arundo donax TaxID=35708 RepID=A0A0A8ZQR9_ARUDO
MHLIASISPPVNYFILFSVQAPIQSAPMSCKTCIIGCV